MTRQKKRRPKLREDGGVRDGRGSSQSGWFVKPIESIELTDHIGRSRKFRTALWIWEEDHALAERSDIFKKE